MCVAVDHQLCCLHGLMGAATSSKAVCKDLGPERTAPSAMPIFTCVVLFTRTAGDHSHAGQDNRGLLQVKQPCPAVTQPDPHSGSLLWGGAGGPGV
jgi:hypothetical protein